MFGRNLLDLGIEGIDDNLRTIYVKMTRVEVIDNKRRFRLLKPAELLIPLQAVRDSDIRQKLNLVRKIFDKTVYREKVKKDFRNEYSLLFAEKLKTRTLTAKEKSLEKYKSFPKKTLY